MKHFFVKPKIYFCEGSMEFLKEIQGSHAFIISDLIIEKLGYLQKSVDYLRDAGIQSTVFTEVTPEPDVKVISHGLMRYLEAEADTIIAIGGGSVIDTAKGILYSLWKMTTAQGKSFQKPLFIAIPSTSGTGSEVTNFAVITMDETKISITDDFIAPDIAILDSTCIRHVPQHVIADTGIDALAHAIEACVSTQASHCSDAIAEKAIQLIFENLPTLYHDANNSKARENIQNASCLAGMSFTNAGLGINHSLAHALGATFHLSHGRSIAMFVDTIIEYNASLNDSHNISIAKKYAKLAAILQLPARTYREGTINFLQAVKELKKSLDIPNRIRDLGINKENYTIEEETMAQLAINDRCTTTNPRQLSLKDLLEILEKNF